VGGGGECRSAVNSRPTLYGSLGLSELSESLAPEMEVVDMDMAREGSGLNQIEMVN
jgi:hypothetical protein